MASRGRGGGGPSRGGGGRKPYCVTTKLYIGNIPETCRKMDLQKLFESHGSVVECDIVKNYGFVVSPFSKFIRESAFFLLISYMSSRVQNTIGRNASLYKIKFFFLICNDFFNKHRCMFSIDFCIDSSHIGPYIKVGRILNTSQTTSLI